MFFKDSYLFRFQSRKHFLDLKVENSENHEEDKAESTINGTEILKKIAETFNVSWVSIDKDCKVDIMSRKGPFLDHFREIICFLETSNGIRIVYRGHLSCSNLYSYMLHSSELLKSNSPVRLL